MVDTSKHHQSTEASGEPPDLSPPERDSWESTELSELPHGRQKHAHPSSPHALDPPGNTAPTGLLGRLTYSISKFWRRQVSVTVDHAACRDHLDCLYWSAEIQGRTAGYSAAVRISLERTFLAYLRTSLTFSMLGVLIAQLFRVQHAPKPNHLIGFYVLGKPLACLCQGAAIATLLIGVVRSWRHQNAIVRGKALAGGFDVIILGVGFFCIFLTFLALLTAVDITKEDMKSDNS
ncbi:hypothetical protein DSL72_008562 [Monilinia vaccinii-corymbosi]|uniref:DUF202 domain-containing protein n=1 Tax=Monilinia vaccinii-corymbosi TaxID=61207 RepID=A0A8A3PRF5_9HELO|nr:hypothetical protein DSL72_008562 [Monilinia vaccinii-corymbosi]